MAIKPKPVSRFKALPLAERTSLELDSQSNVRSYLRDFFNDPTAENHRRVVEALETYESDFRTLEMLAKKAS